MWESILHLRVCSESAVRCAYPFHTTHLLRMCDSVCRIAYACVCVFVFGAPVACTRCVLLSVCNRCCHNTRRTSISHWVRIELFFSVSSDISQWRRRRRARYQQHNSTSRESSFIRFTFHYCSIYCSHSKPIICVIFAMLLLLTLQIVKSELIAPRSSAGSIVFCAIIFFLLSHCWLWPIVRATEWSGITHIG